MSTRHTELRLQGTLEPAFLPLNWKIQTGIYIKPIPADLLLLAPSLTEMCIRDRIRLSQQIEIQSKEMEERLKRAKEQEQVQESSGKQRREEERKR